MGNRWGEGKGDGEEVSTQATWDQSGRESQRNAKEGFQVSERDSGTGEGFSRQREIIKGDRQGVIKGIVPCASDIISTLYVSCQLCVCRANKELCLGYK
jgi:hypothetical protein